MAHNFKSAPVRFAVTLSMAMLLFVTSFIAPLFQVLTVKAAKPENSPADEFFTDFKELADASGWDKATMIDKDNDATIDKGYKFLARMTKETQVTTGGIGLMKYKYNPHYAREGLSNYEDNVVYAYPLNKNNPGGVWAKYTNVGTYEGQPIDVKVTIDSWTETPYKKGENYKPFHPNPVFGGTLKPEHVKALQDDGAKLENGKIVTKSGEETITWKKLPSGDLQASTGMTIKAVPGQENNPKVNEAFYVNGYIDQRYEPMVYFHKKQMGINIGGIDADITYQFLKAGTEEPIDVQGVFTFADLDSMQGLKIYEDPTKFEDFFLHSKTDIMYQELGDGVVFATGDNATEPDDERAMVTFTYGPTSEVKFTYYQKGFPEDWHPSYADINQGPAYFEFIAEKPVKTALDNPVKEIVWFDEESNQEKREDRKRLEKTDEVVKYSVRADIPNEGPETKYSKFIFEDVLDDRLEFANKDFKVFTAMKDAAGKRIELTDHFNIKYADKTVTAQATKKLLDNTSDFKDHFYGQSLYFEFEVKVKEGVVLPGGGAVTIPNVATIENDKEKKESNEVNIIVEDPEPIANILTEKTVNKKEHAYLVNKEEVFTYDLVTKNDELFKKPLPKAKELLIKDEFTEGVEGVKEIKATLTPITLEDKKPVKGEPKDISNDFKFLEDKKGLEGVVTIPAGSVGYIIETTFDAQLTKKDIDRTIEKNNNMIPNNYFAIDKNVYEDKKISDKEKEEKFKSTSNTVHVSVLEVEKKVEGTDLHEVVNREDDFNYTIRTPILQNANRIVVKDKIDDALAVNIENSKVIFEVPEGVEGRTQELESIKPVLDEETNTVTVVLERDKLNESEIKQLKGATMVVHINAKIKETADLTDYPKELIDNKAKVQIDDNREVETNEVKVGETGVKKTVEGKKHFDLANKEDTFTYEITTKVPNKAESFELYDLLEPVLEAKKAELHDHEGSVIKGAAVITKDNPREVTAKLDKKQLEKYNGKEVTLIIEAGLLPSSDISVYKDNLIPNESVLKTKIKGKEQITTSNKVTVRPADVVKKTVNGKIAEKLSTLHDPFVYEIETVVPSGVKNKITITDSLEGVLELAGNKGEMKLVTAEGNKVEFVDQTKGNDVQIIIPDAAKLQGKTLIFSFHAKVKNDISFKDVKDAHKNGKIPNIAKVSYDDGEENPSNKVTVEPRKLEKLVENDVEHEVNSSEDGSSFVYTITTDIPTTHVDDSGKAVKVSGFIIEDKLEPVLELSGTPSIKVEGHTSKDNDVSIEGNTVKFSASKEFLEKHKGKEIVLTIPAKVKEGADLSPYKNGIPNKAYIFTNGQPDGETNNTKVHVNAPTKAVNGVEHYVVASEDEVFEYTIDFDVPEGVSNIVITDELVKELEVVQDTEEQKVVLKEGNNTIASSIEVNGNKVIVKPQKEEYAKISGSTITLHIHAKIKKGADITVYENNFVPNKATVELVKTEEKDGKKVDTPIKLETNEVTVTTNTPVKKVNGKDSEVLGDEKEEFVYEIDYKVPSNSKEVIFKDELKKELEVVEEPVIKHGEEVVKSTVTVEDNVVIAKTVEGEAQRLDGEVITLVIKAKVKAGANLDVYDNGQLPNEATVKVDDNPEVTSNTVTIEVDKPKKKVNGKVEEVLKDADETFVYTISTKVKLDTKEIKFTDELEKELEIVGTPYIKQGENDVKADIKVEDNVVTAVTAEGEAAKYEGKEMTLYIEAKLKAGANLNVFEDGKLPNKALVQFDNNPAVETNEVTVQLDRPVKTVNGKDSETILDRKETFNYEIEVLVPSDTKEVKIEDELEKVLEIVGEPTLKYDEEDVKADITVDGNKVTAITQRGEAEKYANKKIVLTIEAKIKEKADLTVYEDGQVPNVATVQFDDKPAVDTNEVVVDTERPIKTVEGKEEYMLSTMEDKFDYEITTKIPKGKKTVVVTDELVNELKVVDAKTNLENAEVEIDEQTVTATIVEEYMDEYEGKELVLTITAQVKEGVDLSVYKNSQVPNVATVQYDDEPALETNEVLVTPPHKPIKKVEGVEEYQLKDNAEEFEYTVETMIPRGKKHVEVRDTLVDELSMVEGTQKLYSIDVTPEQKIEDVDIKVDGQTISYALEKELLEKYEGRKLVLVFKAQLKPDADLSKYPNGVPNIGELDINHGEEVYKTNEVVVTPVTPADPADPAQPAQPNEPGQAPKQGIAKYLPQMNTKTTVIPLVAGILLIGGAIYYRKRKQETNN